MHTGFYKVSTNYRDFQVEASGIGDAIQKALSLLLKEQGEYLREVTA